MADPPAEEHYRFCMTHIHVCPDKIINLNIQLADNDNTDIIYM